MRVLLLVIILTTQACAYNWRAQYSGNDDREVTPALKKVLTEEFKEDDNNRKK